VRSKLVVPVTAAFFLFAALAHLGFFDGQRLARGFRNLGILGSEMIPPDMEILPTAGAALWETVEMSFAGTLLGFLASLPLSILGTRRLFSSWVAHIARFVAAGIRTIPVLLWAIVFVILFGLGPLAGTFGIAAYTVGYLAKIYADLFEGTDPEILEAVGSTGASRLQLVRFVFLPEGANAILTQLLFMIALVLLLILVVVLAMDGLSAWVRKRFLLTAQ